MCYFTTITLVGIILVFVILIRSKYPTQASYGDKIVIPDAEKIEIRVMQGTMSRARITASFYVPATLFASENYLLITQKKRSILNIYISSLPLVIWKSERNMVELPFPAQSIKPSKLELTNWQKLNIEFVQENFLNVSYQLTIDLQREEATRFLKQLNLENWISTEQAYS